MSVSADFMQQALGGLLQYSQPSVTSGLLSGNDPTMNFGLSLLANSNSGGRFGQILGRSALDTQQLGMQNAMNRLQLAQGAVGLGATLQKQQAIMDYLGGGSQSPTSQSAASVPPPQQQAFYPGISQMPAPGVQTGVQTDQMPQQVAGYSASAPDDISQLPINGIPAQTYKRLAVLMGKDPLTVEKETYERQLQIAQQQVKPQISALDTVVKSESPAREVAADPVLQKIWKQAAPTLGLNPITDFNDKSVRAVLNSARNRIASRVGIGDEAPIVSEQTINGALGSIYQRNPVTGKLTQVKGEESLKDVIDPATGLPTNVRASQAEGKQPFNPSIYGAANVSDQALQFAADTYRATGKFPASLGRNPAMQAKVLDKIAADAKANGDEPGAIAARAASLKANSQALDALTKQQNMVGSYEQTARKNIDLAEQELGKLELSGVPVVNKALNAWRQGVSGDPTTAGFVNALTAARTEYAKVLSGATGATGVTDAGRREAEELFNKNMNPDALRQAFNVARQEMANRMSSFEDQRKSLVGHLSQNSLQTASEPTSDAAPSKPAGAPAVGQVVKGYRFKGGNPADRNSWEKAGG